MRRLIPPLLLLLVACTTQHARISPYRELPSMARLQKHVRKLGAETVVARIRANPELPRQLCAEVSSVGRMWVGFDGAEVWLVFVVALRDASDGPLRECLESELIDAVSHAAIAVLTAVRTSPDRTALLDQVCRGQSGGTEGEPDYRSWRAWTLMLLEDVPDELAPERDACLATIQSRAEP